MQGYDYFWVGWQSSAYAGVYSASNVVKFFQHRAAGDRSICLFIIHNKFLKPNAEEARVNTKSFRLGLQQHEKILLND